MEQIVEKDTTKFKSRIDYLDIAKFLGILLVILGHTTGNFDNPLYRVIIYTFHMPLFFLVSGMTINRKNQKYDGKHWLTFFKKNLLALMVPYLIWALIFSKFSFNNFPGILYGSYETIVEVGTLTSLWYIPSFFMGRLLTEIILMVSSFFPKKIKQEVLTFAGAIILFTIGFLLPHPQKGMFWCFDVGFIVAGFMLIGYSLKTIVSKLYLKPIWLFIIINIVAVGLLATGILVQNGNPTLVLICKTDYGNLGLFFLNSLAGSFMILSLSIIISKLFIKHQSNIIYRFILWVGSCTFGIFLIHKNFLQEVVLANFTKWGIQLPHLGYAILASIIAFIFSCVVVYLIYRFVPQLFGRYSKPKDMIIEENDLNINNLSRKDSENNNK